jgi:hypothetical protein
MSAPASGPGASGAPPQIVIPGAGWVDVLSRAIVQVGFPVVVAGVLLWFLLTRFQDTMTVITTRMSANTEAAGRLVDAATLEYSEIQRQSGELSRQTALLQQIADDGKRITEIRSRELEELQGIGKRMPAREPPR